MARVVLAALLLVGCTVDIGSGIKKECAALVALWVEEVNRLNPEGRYRECVAAKIGARMRAAEVGR